MTLPNHDARNTINAESRGSPLSAEFGNGDSPLCSHSSDERRIRGESPSYPPPSTVIVTYVHKWVTFAWP